MKKAILLIAALLVCGTLAFADTSIGIWGRTVFNMAGSGTQINGADAIGVGWGPNWDGQESTRMGVNFSFSSKTLSFKITEYFGGAPSGNGSADLVNMYGTCKIIPDMLTIIVGRVRGDGFDDFRKTQPNPNSDMNNNLGRMAGWGLWLVFAPKDLGLEIAVNMMTPNPGSVPGYNVNWQLTGGYHTPFSWQAQLHNINVGASYTIPDIVKITAAFMNQCPGNDTIVNSDWAASGAPGNGSQYEIYARFDVLAIQGMTLWLDGAFTGFETADYKLQMDLGFGYRIGDLGLYLAGKAMIPLTAGDPTINANLEVTYNIKPITIGLIVASQVPLASGSDMQFEFQPYVSLDDISMRIAFDYLLHSNGTTGVWNVPIFFTFSF